MNDIEEKFNGVLKVDENKNRNKEIVKTSIIGIITNVLLALFKAIVGFLSNSIAIILDAVNNISDAASSLITIIGTKLASKDPDKKHPFGYGRIEYLSAMIIAIIVLYAGFTSLIESIKKIINPETSDYSVVSLIIVAVAVLVKIILGRYVKNKGKKLNSSSLVNSGDDATLDSIISASTLLAAILYLIFNISLEAILGAIISLVIVKSGLEMLKEALSSILGERVDIELIKDIKKTINSFPDVSGVYDLVFNNYGPNSYTGSVHIEIPDTYTVDKLDELIKEITLKVYLEHNVILSAIGIYSVNTKDKNAIEAKKNIRKLLNKYKTIIQMHGFYFDTKRKIIRFDIVISFDEENKEKLYQEVYNKVQELYPNFKIIISLDNDFSVS